MVHSPGTNVIKDALNGTFNFLFFQAGGWIMPTGGDLTWATSQDRQWLILSFLERSTNVAPPQIIEQGDISYTDPFFGKFRLANYYGIQTDAAYGVFQSISPDGNWTGIGPTRLRFRGSIRIPVGGNPQLGITRGSLITIPLRLLNDLFDNVGAPNFQDAQQWENGKIGGGVGQSYVAQRNAARIGPLLIPFEDYFTGGLQPPPFANEIVFRVQPHTLTKQIVVSDHGSVVLNTKGSGVTWPTARSYKYIGNGEYQLETVYPQIASPTQGFLPWPPPQTYGPPPQ